MHTDARGVGATIGMVSFTSDAIMTLRRGQDNEGSPSSQASGQNNRPPQDQVDLLLRPGSLLVLAGEARYTWSHGILPEQQRHREHAAAERQSLVFWNTAIDPNAPPIQRDETARRPVLISSARRG